MGTRLHPSLKKYVLANPQKAYVSIDGVYFDFDLAKKLLKEPNSFTKKDITKVTNQEQLRVIADRLGDIFVDLMDFQMVSKDQFGELIFTELLGQKLYYCKVVCPTERKPYYLSVAENLEAALNLLETYGAPKNIPWWNENRERAIWPADGTMKTAHQAVAWTFFRKTEEYNPIIQT